MLYLGQNIQERSLWKIDLSRPYPFKFFKGCLPQILLGPFLNTLSHLYGRICMSLFQLRRSAI